MQRKRKSKVHPLTGGWEDSHRNIALGVRRTQDFIVVCTDVDGHFWKTSLCVIDSHLLVAEALKS
jgi:hypothetical protein